ncbi:hypothetical protein GW758_01265 [Candidatus Falkowbacteria bacterium]|nr:hypothetical protein [Candidatus Falkowbacteria bacterium]NCT54571.1 hypothetical protein [Candidatus Falkowbacteria bacterium]
MKKIKFMFLTLSFLIISSVVIGQDNLAFYNEQGKSGPLSKIDDTRQEYHEAEFAFIVIGEGVYPRMLFNGYSLYKSGFGVVGFSHVDRIRINGFAEKGYPPIQSELAIFVSAALMYNISSYNNSYVFGGLGNYYGKNFWGPIAGIKVENENWDLLFMGQLCLKSDMDQMPEVDISFDPNSWYRIKLMRRFNEKLSFGLYSERFYLSGCMIEYDVNPNTATEIKLIGYLGRELEFGGNSNSIGLSLKISNLNKK